MPDREKHRIVTISETAKESFEKILKENSRKFWQQNFV